MSGDEVLANLNGRREGSIMESLDIKVTLAEPDHVMATMPVGPRTVQQMGFLHGGASVTLAESIASIGTFLNIDPARQTTFGLEINANHVRPKREGIVTGEGTPLHKGRTNMGWDIKIRDEDGKLICVSRCTVAIVDRPSPNAENWTNLSPATKE